MFFKLSILLGAPFLNNQYLKIIVIEDSWLEIFHFRANAHTNETWTADTQSAFTFVSGLL